VVLALGAKMRTGTVATALLLAATGAWAQVNSSPNITIPATNGSIPAPGPNGCAAGYYPGRNVVIYTVPYTYTQVLSIIGNYTNLTWSGSPDNSVTTNNSLALQTNNWTPGTARTYDLSGAHVIETITTYLKPNAGPYVEIHTLAPLTILSANVSLYADYDAQYWYPVCDGKATWTNFTINFCATNVTAATQILYQLHSTDAVTVGQFLGGQNFSSCEALGVGNGTANGTAGTNGTSSAPVRTGTGVPRSSGTAPIGTGTRFSGSSSVAASATSSSGGAPATTAAPSLTPTAYSSYPNGAIGLSLGQTSGTVAVCVIAMVVGLLSLSL
jgi:hypothetical protein